ncbi:hypothetical protein NQ317_001539 [Molorchus minor]|uniref:Double jelly roll-like domain-containing protein n=1 Tax=Molorchus minor TaxID=1323400 RepID=A0ABQ9JNW1_9CUCU|nr:hypothetical protein NQ317_001539 [Molorchus minor]
MKRLKLYKTIEKPRPILMSFRSWDLYEYPNLPKSTHNIWRSNKMNNINENPSKFDHCKLVNLKVYLNSEVYPYDNLNISYKDNRYALLYLMYARFQESYYRNKSLPLLNPNDFKDFAPLVVVDCSHQNEEVKKWTY